MKRLCIVVFCFWLLAINTFSMNNQINYEIKYASNSTNLWEIKQELIEAYQDIVAYVDDDYHYEIISGSIFQFETIRNSKASMKGNTVMVIIGDGKGLAIHGTFKPTCKVEVKKKSILVELFQGK